MNLLSHSAKGTTWDDHKYIKKENGRYYYPETSRSKKSESFDNLLKRSKETSRSKMSERFDRLTKRGKETTISKGSEKFNEVMKKSKAIGISKLASKVIQNGNDWLENNLNDKLKGYSITGGSENSYNPYYGKYRPLYERKK